MRRLVLICATAAAAIVALPLQSALAAPLPNAEPVVHTDTWPDPFGHTETWPDPFVDTDTWPDPFGK